MELMLVVPALQNSTSCHIVIAKELVLRGMHLKLAILGFSARTSKAEVETGKSDTRSSPSMEDIREARLSMRLQADCVQHDKRDQTVATKLRLAGCQLRGCVSAILAIANQSCVLAH